MPTSVPTSERAFPSTPRVDRYFGAESCEAARKRLTTCVERGEGPALLIGAAGCGKTVMMNVFAEAFAGRMRVVRLAGAQVVTRRALLQTILHGLDESIRGLDDGELWLALNDSIADRARTPIALLVDEAQALPARLLEELRLLSGAVLDGEPRVMVVLAGTNRLDESFTAPELDSFNQRIAARCYLHPLTRDETIQYVRAHVAAVGGDPDALFSPDAYDALFQATDGTPRLINQLGDRALVLAVERGEQLVTGAAIQEAWSDLHQLPAPWHTPSVVAPAQPEAAEAIDDDETLGVDPIEDAPIDDAVNVAPIQGIWNADEGLESVAETGDQSESPDNACVAYAFPTQQDEGEFAPFATPPTGSPAESTDGASDADEPAQPEVAIAADPDSRDGMAVDPFAEPFDDEEVVLDRYSKLEAVLRPGVARVENLREVEFGRMFEALAPAVESLIEDVETKLSEPAAETGLSVVATDDASEAAIAPDADDEPLLVIDDDLLDPTGDVERREYTRLFSSLRQA